MTALDEHRDHADVDAVAAVIYDAAPGYQRVRPGGDPMDHRDWEDVPFADLPEQDAEKEHARRRALAVLDFLAARPPTAVPARHASDARGL